MADPGITGKRRKENVYYATKKFWAGCLVTVSPVLAFNRIIEFVNYGSKSLENIIFYLTKLL
jgi:hypothetical protein